MNRNDILEIINIAGKRFSSTEKVSFDVIKNEIELPLNVTLPESYKWYVSEFGSGGVGNVDILGIGYDGYNTCLECFNDNEEFGLQKQLGLVPVYNMDEYIYCLDTKDMKDGECPVVIWGIGVQDPMIKYPTFYDFIYDFFKNALEQ